MYISISKSSYVSNIYEFKIETFAIIDNTNNKKSFRIIKYA